MGYIVVYYGLQLGKPIVPIEGEDTLREVPSIFRGKFVGRMISSEVSGGGRVHLHQCLHKAERRRLAIAAPVPSRIILERVFCISVKDQVVARWSRRSNDWNGYVHEPRIVNHPFESLYSTHGDAHNRVEVGQMERLRHQPVLSLDHVSRCEGGKLGASLAPGVRGR